ncbi:MAG: four helix bundle protein [Bacteroidota bacterium]
MENEKRKYDLEERLIRFSVMIISLAESLPGTQAGKYLAGQIIRSGLSPALNYGEAKGAESISDFIHKMKIGLKELRETHIALQIINAKPFTTNADELDKCFMECNELISIYVKSIQTAHKRKSNNS